MDYRLLLLITVLFGFWTYAYSGKNQHEAEVDDNDFAEFEDFDDEEVSTKVPPASSDESRSQQQPQKDAKPVKKVVMAPEFADNDAEQVEEDDATVEEDEEDFEHFHDEDEFEGYDKDQAPPTKGKSQEKPPDLKIAKVPIHFQTNWDSFYMEMLMLAGLGVYLLNFLAGKTKNNKLAQAWLSVHKELLEKNFAIVGDDGTQQEVQRDVLMKESENVYSLWCSGRVCCEGMLVTLKLLKRQDLVSTITRLIRPASDQIIIKVMLDEDEMDTFVFCLASKKVCSRLHKEVNDLSVFCTEKKGVDAYDLPSSFQLLSEIGEASGAILDAKVCKCINEYEELIEYIHVSDQYSGPKQAEDSSSTKLPDIKKVLLFCFNAPGQGHCNPKDMATMRPLLQLVFYLMDRVRKIRLSKEGKQKAEKNRQKVLQEFQRATHAQRSEAAQQRKEDKKRAEKEKMMQEDDPDKQRKLEAKSLKKDKKQNQPKVKMMKVKSM